MAKAEASTLGGKLAQKLAVAGKEAAAAPLPGARDLPVLRGLTSGGKYIPSLENVLVGTGTILTSSEKVFLLGDAAVQEVDGSGATGLRLVCLQTGGRTEAGAEDYLANLFVCEEEFKGNPVQFPPPRGLVETLLRSEPARRRLPVLRLYSRTPVFDEGFVFRGPGWHKDVGILVHGPAVDPVMYQPGNPDEPVRGRLPPHLATLLEGFCFAQSADIANAVGWLLTGLLANHFVAEPKAMALLDGNQPGVGKSLLCRAVGVLFGGFEPPLIPYTPDDDELGKRICANLRDPTTRILVVDNAKVRGGDKVESRFVESNSMAETVSLRILGQSVNLTRPNDLLWAITMNETRVSDDLFSRSVPIRLAHEGDPKNRVFTGPDPVRYAREHRIDLLAELAGMVELWGQKGRPPGTRGHRCTRWGRVVGGIMEAAGFPEFLANAGDAANSFSSSFDELAALAEAAVKTGGNYVVITTLIGEKG